MFVLSFFIDFWKALRNHWHTFENKKSFEILNWKETKGITMTQKRPAPLLRYYAFENKLFWLFPFLWLKHLHKQVRGPAGFRYFILSPTSGTHLTFLGYSFHPRRHWSVSDCILGLSSFRVTTYHIYFCCILNWGRGGGSIWGQGKKAFEASP